MKSKSSFKHESLVDKATVIEFLESLKKSIKKGDVSFSDGEGELSLQPQGAMYLKVKASDEEGRQQIELKVRWDHEPKALATQPPKIN